MLEESSFHVSRTSKNSEAPRSLKISSDWQKIEKLSPEQSPTSVRWAGIAHEDEDNGGDFMRRLRSYLILST